MFTSQLPKASTETRSLFVDFLSLLQQGETISTQVCTASVFSGVDASPSSIISGAASVNGTKVYQKVTGGVNGAIYLLKYTITTSLGNTLSIFSYLAVVDNPL